MPEVAEEYAAALIREMVKAKVLESATGDIAARVLRDRPSDIGGYLETCKAMLPSYFAPVPTAAPVDPEPGTPEYNSWFLANAERIAGSPTLRTAAAEKGALTTGSGQAAPRVLKRSDPGFDKLMLQHLEGIAAGTIEVV